MSATSEQNLKIAEGSRPAAKTRMVPLSTYKKPRQIVKIHNGHTQLYDLKQDCTDERDLNNI